MRSDCIEVVLVTRNSAGHIGACADSVVAAGALPIVVDNGSTDETLEIVRSKCPDARIIATGENLGYGKAMNLGFKETKGEYVILSNPDVVFLKDSIRKMVAFLRENATVGVTGPQQMFPDGSWQRSYGDLPGIWTGIKHAVGITTLQNQVKRALWPRRLGWKPREVPYVDGAVLAVRREAYLEMSGFDENFFFYSDESDLCARLKKAGWRVMFFPDALVIHIRGADSASRETPERFLKLLVSSQCRLASKHLPRWKAEIYFRLQIAHFARLRSMYRLMELIEKPNLARHEKIRMFDTLVHAWRERLPRGAESSQ